MIEQSPKAPAITPLHSRADANAAPKRRSAPRTSREQYRGTALVYIETPALKLGDRIMIRPDSPLLAGPAPHNITGQIKGPGHRDGRNFVPTTDGYLVQRMIRWVINDNNDGHKDPIELYQVGDVDADAAQYQQYAAGQYVIILESASSKLTSDFNANFYIEAGPIPRIAPADQPRVDGLRVATLARQEHIAEQLRAYLSGPLVDNPHEGFLALALGISERVTGAAKLAAADLSPALVNGIEQLERGVQSLFEFAGDAVLTLVRATKSFNIGTLLVDLCPGLGDTAGACELCASTVDASKAVYQDPASLDAVGKVALAGIDLVTFLIGFIPIIGDVLQKLLGKLLKEAIAFMRRRSPRLNQWLTDRQRQATRRVSPEAIEDTPAPDQTTGASVEYDVDAPEEDVLAVRRDSPRGAGYRPIRSSDAVTRGYPQSRAIVTDLVDDGFCLTKFDQAPKISQWHRARLYQTASGQKYVVKISHAPRGELAYYHLSQKLGMDNVPAVAVVKLEDGTEIAAMEFIAGTQIMAPQGIRDAAEYLGTQPTPETSVLDFLVGNADRNSGNTLVSGQLVPGPDEVFPDKKIWAIDNELSFGLSTPEDMLQYVADGLDPAQNFDDLLQQASADMIARVKALRPEDFTEGLIDLVPEIRVAFVQPRLDYLLQRIDALGL